MRAPGGWHVVAAMEIDKPPFDNPDLRLALKYATNREQILQGLVQRRRVARQRSPDSLDRSLLQSGTAAAQIRSRARPPFHFKKAGLADPNIVLQVSDSVFNGAVDMAQLMKAACERPQDPHGDQEGAGRRVLGQRLAQGRLCRELLGRPRRGDPDARRRLRRRRALERDALEERQVREAARRRQGRSRRGQAQALHLGNAEDAAARTAARSFPVFKDWLDAHHEKVGGHTPHGGFDMDNGYILQKAWITSLISTRGAGRAAPLGRRAAAFAARPALLAIGALPRGRGIQRSRAPSKSGSATARLRIGGNEIGFTRASACGEGWGVPRAQTDRAKTGPRAR